MSLRIYSLLLFLRCTLAVQSILSKRPVSCAEEAVSFASIWCCGWTGVSDGLVTRMDWCFGWNGVKQKELLYPGLSLCFVWMSQIKYANYVNFMGILYLIRLPPPGECDLYYVNRDTLFFLYHKERVIFAGLVDESKNNLPDTLCVIQVCLEGQISRESSIKSVPACIATHPTAMKLGYGSAALELLTR
nr:RNA cytidine acetyltransferase 1 isoform X1 [Ipomoea batatas]